MTGIVRYVIEEICDRYVIEEMYEIVFSQGLYDVGLCIEKNRDGTPKRVMGRADKYHPDGASYYGGVDLFPWVHSGKYVEKYEWLAKTNQQMSVQDVADAFGINLNKLRRKHCKDDAAETMKLRKQYTDGLFDTIKYDLTERYAKGFDLSMRPNSVYSYMIDSYERGVSDALRVIKSVVEQHQGRK